MADYANLAYIGKFVTLQNKGKNKKIDYQGDPLTRATLNKAALDEIANCILVSDEAYIEVAMSDKVRIKNIQAALAAAQAAAAGQAGGAGAPTTLHQISGLDYLAEIVGEIYGFTKVQYDTHLNSLDGPDKEAFKEKVQQELRGTWSKKAA